MTYGVIVNCLLQWLHGNRVIKLKYNNKKKKKEKTVKDQRKKFPPSAATFSYELPSGSPRKQ